LLEVVLIERLALDPFAPRPVAKWTALDHLHYRAGRPVKADLVDKDAVTAATGARDDHLTLLGSLAMRGGRSGRVTVMGVLRA
jgi:hypothetical protein